MNTTTPTCPSCKSPLEGAVTDGLCPACLLREGLTPPEDAAPPPSIKTLQPLFPELQLLRLLGSGGMGAVYEARQPKLDRIVALKVMRSREDPQFAERFAREARLLARLRHPNIVAIHDSGQVDGVCYLLMEHVPGRTLREVMGGGPLDPEHATYLFRQICDALQYAHERGVIHRDVKPENILVDDAGNVRIADFGLAKLLGPDADGSLALTETRHGVGTPHYMAPEQLDGSEHGDARVDVYALGVVFYEMLTGQLPIGRFAEPSKLVPIDPALDAVVLRALESDPDARPSSAAALVQPLTDRGPRPSQPTRRSTGHGQPRREPSDEPRLPRAAYYVLLWAGVIGFVGMLCKWGEAREPFGQVVSFGAWNSNTWGVPNGLLGILCVVAAGIAAGSLARMWRTPWSAFLFMFGYVLLQTGYFSTAISSYGGSLSAGAVLTILAALAGVAAAISIAASEHKAATALRGRKRRSTRRRRTTPRRIPKR